MFNDIMTSTTSLCLGLIAVYGVMIGGFAKLALIIVKTHMEIHKD